MKIKYFFIDGNNDVIVDMAQQERSNIKCYASTFRYI